MKKFEKYLRTLNYSELTIRSYLSDLRLCIDKEIIDNKLSFVDQRKLLELNRSAATICRITSAIKRFEKYLLKTGEISKLVTAEIELPKIKGKNIEIIEQKEMANLMSKYKNDKEIYLILSLLYSTGARISSIAGLRIEDIGKEQISFNTAKGGKPYVSILTDNTKKAIRNYTSKKAGYLFSKNRITPDCIRKRMERKMGKDYINPHLIRHTAATALLENNVDITDIQWFLNHSCLATTERYIHLGTKKRVERLKGKLPL